MSQEHKTRITLRDLLKYIIPLIISVGLCYLLFTGIDFKEMMEIIREQCDFKWILIAMGISVLSHVVRAFRWRIQLNALGIEAPKRALIWSIFGTYAVNLVFPRLGEVWRCGYIANRQNAPFTAVFGSMVADRLADTITVAVLICGTFLLASKEIMSYLDQNIEGFQAVASMLASPWLWIAVVAVVAGVWYFMAHDTTNKVVKKIQDWVKELWQGFVVVIKMKGRGKFVAFTMGIWGCYFLQLYICFFAFPFTRELLAEHGVLAALVTFILSSLAQAVPSNGGIGPWQWAVIFALGIYGVAKTPASAFANLVMACTTLTLIILGIYTFISIALDKKQNIKINQTVTE